MRLLEQAHWLVVGEKRRRQVDYGYWYEADGRNAARQREFERVEILPQALEWVLTKACNHNFEVSIDNLSGEVIDASPFKDAVYAKVISLQTHGLNARAEQFRLALACFYQTERRFKAMVFARSALDRTVED